MVKTNYTHKAERAALNDSFLRDRALLAVMVIAFARVSAVVGMNGERYLPARESADGCGCMKKAASITSSLSINKAEEYLDDYVKAAGIAHEKGAPL